MRESKRIEKTHLPRDSTAIWLESQATSPSEVKHEKPPEGTYEAWIEKRVGESREGRKMTLNRSVDAQVAS